MMGVLVRLDQAYQYGAGPRPAKNERMRSRIVRWWEGEGR